MKKLLALCAGMMLLASAAMAQTNGLQLAWGACANNALATPTQVFDCDPFGGSTYTLYGTFSLAAPAANIIAVDNIVDFLYPDPPADVPPFWQFQGGGCNNAGLTLTHVRPATTFCASATNSILLCGSGGSSCNSFITAYVFGASVGFSPDRARLFTTIARPASSPVTLTNTTRHYMFGLNFFMDLAPDPATPGSGCAGCSDAVGITWNNAVFYNNAAGAGQEATGVVLSSTDPGSTPSTGANCVACVTVPTKAKSWGQLKSLYR